VVEIGGLGRMPGGIKHDPPEASGVGEWDRVGGLAGEGGLGHIDTLRAGNNGAVRICKPGYF
jgi:hypothetical protein